MKGYPLQIDNIETVEDGQTVRCQSEETDIQNNQFFVETRPNRNSGEIAAPIFQMIEERSERTTATLVIYHSRMVIRKL